MKYSVKAAAMATGVSESRLRTWERRYGIPRPQRSASGRRQYDEDDIAVIRRMSALVDAGMPASDAAAAAMLEEQPSVRETAAPDHELVSGLLDAALAYNEDKIVEIVRGSSDEMGWDRAIEEVLFPGLRKIGEYWGEDSIISANEHFATEVIRREISRALSDIAPADGEAPSVALACPEDERHEVGLLALSLLLRQRGVRVYYLGADVPSFDLMLAVRQTRADALCLAATLASSLASLGRAARNLVSGRLPARLFVGGPALHAATGTEMIPGIHLPTSVSAAATVIADAIRGDRKEAQS
jgi:MerR family transcriptional regulator, light-induced transcriptional regulator